MNGRSDVERGWRSVAWTQESEDSRPTMESNAGKNLRPLMIGIAGTSGSGKTTLSEQLARTLGGRAFSIDHYYRDLDHLPLEERAASNFDDPAMLRSDLLVEQLRELAAGRAVEAPVYDFASCSTVAGEALRVEPGEVMVVEGLFTLYFPELRPLYSLSVYVDTPDAVCYERRLRRDVLERGRDSSSVARQYDRTVRPCGLAFVRPLIDFADVVIEGTDAMDFNIERVLHALRRRRLWPR